MSSSPVASGFTGITALAYSSGRDLLVVAEAGGRIAVVDLLRKDGAEQEVRRIGRGYDKPSRVLTDGPSKRLVVQDQSGVWLCRLDEADQQDATALLTSPGGQALGIVAGGAESLLVMLDEASPPRLTAYALSAPVAQPVLALPAGATVLATAVSPDGKGLFLLIADAQGPALQYADIATGQLRSITTTPLPVVGQLVPMTADWVLVDGADGDLVAVAGDGRTRTSRAVGPWPAPRISAVMLKTGEFVVATDSEIDEVQLPVGLVDPVWLRMPEPSLFIGSYAPVSLDLAGSGVALADLDLVVDDGDLGSVSPSTDETFDPDAPQLLVAAGWKAGTGLVQAVNRATGKVVGRVPFEVAGLWNQPDAGPSFVTVGKCDAPVVKPAYGGGGPGPQNIDIFKAPAAWRVAIVLIDTTTNQYPTGAALTAIQNAWRAAMTTGVPVGGVTRSVAGYYTEVSYGKLTMSLVGNAVTAPLHAAGNWDDYFEVENKPNPANPGTTVPDSWNPKPDAWQAFASALESANAAEVAAGRAALVNLAQTDAVVFVVRTANAPFAATPPTSTSIGRFVWPQQTTMAVKLNGSDRNLPMVMMPADWTAIDGRQVYATLAHELGHSLGLPDLYLYDWMNQAQAPRELGRWDLMCEDGEMPQLSLPARMALGWVRDTDLKTFNFANNGGVPVNENVTIHALEKSSVPAGARRGIEVRVAEGRNYYFEYRNRQGTSLGDATLPVPQVVVGVDVASPKGAQSFDARPWTLRLKEDPDAVDDTDGTKTEGAFLAAGHDYREKDFTDGAPKDVVVLVTATRADSADVQVRYDSEARPELSIRTWPNGDKQWQSPDIEVRNAKSKADAKWLNVPWTGHPNTVVARVHNRGGIEARDVRASFSILDFTTNGGKPAPTAQPLGTSDPVTIPAKGDAELTIDWVPPQAGHYCITVDIPLYEDPVDPTIHESSDRDNWAQTNYTRFCSDSASPSSRKVFSVQLENPTNTTVVVYPGIRQTSEFYRTYLEHRWLRLRPKQTAQIRVMTESLDGDPTWQSFIDRRREQLWGIPGTVEISGWVQGRCVARCVGGASVEVTSGRRTVFRDISFFAEPGAAGTIVSADGSPANRGTVLMTALWEGELPERERSAVGEVGPDGRFFVYLQDLERGMQVQLHYLGDFGLAPSESELLIADF